MIQTASAKDQNGFCKRQQLPSAGLHWERREKSLCHHLLSPRHTSSLRLKPFMVEDHSEDHRCPLSCLSIGQASVANHEAMSQPQIHAASGFSSYRSQLTSKKLRSHNVARISVANGDPQPCGDEEQVCCGQGALHVPGLWSPSPAAARGQIK